MPGELRDTQVWVREQSEANRVYNKGWYGRPRSGGALSLDLVEAAHLLETGRLQVREDDETASFERFVTRAASLNPEFEIQYLAYRELRGKGFHVQTATPTLRAGGVHFALPPKGARTSKEVFAYARAQSERAAVRARDLVVFAERCEADHKEGLVGVVDEESEVTLYEAGLAQPRGALPPTTLRETEAVLLLDRVLIWDAGAAERLHAAEFFGKPVAGSLHLSLVEALHLVQQRQLHVVDAAHGKRLSASALLRAARKIEPGIDRRLEVYDDLKRRHLAVKTGYKFGTHFRAYETDPEGTHAPFLVHVVEADERLEWPQISRAVRLAHGVRKTLLLAFRDGDRIRYLRLSRSRY